MKTIVLTGGGTAGHVTPNLALLPFLKEDGWTIHYIGSRDGIEKRLVLEAGGVEFHGISCGKMRRYFSLKNFVDPFKVIGGFFSSFVLLGKIKPNVVFSKGGFVSVPVCAASLLRRIPVVLHESDITPGLANKLSFPSARAVCYTFSETQQHLKKKKTHLTGTPLRQELFQGQSAQGRLLCGFENDKPVLLVMGGSTGALAINTAVRSHLDELLENCNIIHIAGKGNVDETYNHTPGYKQFEYVGDELPHLFALTDFVISRAGANAMFEILSLKKPALFIPLPLSASRGDQIKNAASFERLNCCLVLPQERLDQLPQKVHELIQKSEKLVSAIEEHGVSNGTQNVLRVICQNVKERK